MNKIFLLMKNKKISVFFGLAIVSILVDTVRSYLAGTMTQAALDRNLEVLIPVSIYELLSYFIVNSLNYFARVQRETYTQKVATWLRQKAVTEFENKYITRDHFSEGSKYVNLAISDAQFYEQYFADVLRMCTMGLEILTVAIFLVNVNISVLIFDAVFFVAMILLPRFFEGKLGQGMEKVSQATEEMTANIENHISAAPMLKNLNAFSLLRAIAFKSSTRVVQEKVKRVKTDTKYNAIMVSFNAFSQVALLCYATFLAFQGYIQFGMIYALTNLSGQFFSSLYQLLSYYPSLAYLKKIVEGYDFQAQAQDDLQLKLPAFRTLSLRNVSYQFDAKKIVFPNMDIRKGEKYVITGESGSGKTTLINVLTGNYRSYEGDIRLDNRSFREFSYYAIKNTISTMTQSVAVLNGSIKYNIVLNAPYDDLKFQEVLKKAKLADLMAELPEGAETMLNSNGLNLSGGQLQRIALARTLYKASDLVVLDEGTANLDKETALDIERTLFTDPQLTVIMITHHLSDQIAQLADHHIHLGQQVG